VTGLRLASLNLFSGRSLQDGMIDADRLVAAIGSLRADVLALQEVDRGQSRSGLVDQAALAAGAVAAAASGKGVAAGAAAADPQLRYQPTVIGTPGVPGWRPAPEPVPGPDGGTAETPVPDGPSYGIALVSRIPVRRWHVLYLHPPRGRFPLPVPSRPPRILMLPDEPRAVIAAELEQPRLTVACAHLSFVPGVNVQQLRRARRWLARLPGPVLLLGDLNLPGRMATRFSGGQPLVTAPTFPVNAPRIQLDHALLLGPLPAGSTAAGEVRTLSIGDHAAVVLDLTLAGGT
jgi:endonuclease/exonuclease/phosphatase family metal-dependent hydrolase